MAVRNDIRPMVTPPPAPEPQDSPKSSHIIVPALGICQIIAWGTTYYLPAVLAKPISDDTGWSLAWVVGGLSIGLLVAGLISPYVGNFIQRNGGRAALSGSAVFFSAGLAGLALSTNLAAYIISWLLLGLGMGAGLYDAAFATLGRIYGQRARAAIATLTLFGGFASTVCWPMSATLVSHVGWRGTCIVYAIVHIALVLPLYVLTTPGGQTGSGTSAMYSASDHTDATEKRSTDYRFLFVLVASVITISSMVSTLVSVHLLTILQAQGIQLSTAVALGTIVGPCQVGARAIEMAISRFHHPIWTKLTSTVCVTAGIGLIWVGFPIMSVALVLYGAGIGIESIARGTLPLAVFGSERYASIMGRIAFPSLIAQAASPSLGALLIERVGVTGAVATLLATLSLNIVLVVVLFRIIRTREQAV